MEIEKLYFIDKVKIASTPLKNSTQKPVTFLPILGNIVYGSFSDNFNFSMKTASRAYNFCFISKRHVVFRWQSVGQIKTRLNAKKCKKDWNKFIFWLFKCVKFLPSRFTVLVTHSITWIILPLSNIIICFKLSYPWKQTTEQLISRREYFKRLEIFFFPSSFRKVHIFTAMP